MEQYNVRIPDSVVVDIADKVIGYLTEYPEDSVDCTIMKVILDRKSRFSHESIMDTASELTFPLLFNGEEVDQHHFILRMFDVREYLLKRVRERVEEYSNFSIIDPRKHSVLDGLRDVIVSIINEHVPTLKDIFTKISGDE